MIRVLLIAPSADLGTKLRKRMQEAPGANRVVLMKSFDRYPPWDELAGAMRAHDPQAVFVDISSDSSAIRVTGEMQSRWPSVSFVAFDEQADTTRLVECLRAGVREFLSAPFPETDYSACIQRILTGMDSALPSPPQEASTKAVFAFLPAKPGSGASTVSINTALAVSRFEDNPTLLMDLDLGNGVTRFHLKAEHPYSIQDALDRAQTLEPGVWTELAAKCGRLDLLASAPAGPAVHANLASVAPLFEFVRKQYGTVLLDCSGYLDAFALECLAQCRRILLVAEPDMTTVHLGREKLRVLQAAELDDRVELVINRWHKNSVLSLADIEGVLGIAAEHMVPEDAKSAYQGVLRGSGVDPVSSIGKACQSIAESLGVPAMEQPASGSPNRKRMVEYFSVSPARYSLFPNARS
jgi:pilus assembly protein CpaE